VISDLQKGTKLGVYLIGSSSLFHIPGPLTKVEFDTDPSQANSIYEQRDERRFNRLGRLGVSLEHKLDDLNSVSSLVYINPKYLQRSERGTFRDFTKSPCWGNIIYHNNILINQEIKIIDYRNG
jgi:hypothetical protein